MGYGTAAFNIFLSQALHGSAAAKAGQVRKFLLQFLLLLDQFADGLIPAVERDILH